MWRNGDLVDEPADVTRYWRDDLVGFLLGCSHTFEGPLKEAGIDVEHPSSPAPPVYITTRQVEPAGRVRGSLVPQLVQTPPEAGYSVGASVTGAGLFMLPMAVTMLFASPLAGRIGARTGFKLPLVLACGIGAAGFVLYAVAHGQPWMIAAGSAVLGVGVGLAYAAIGNLVLGAVDPRQSGEAAGINTILRTVGGAVGAQIAASIVASEPVPGTSVPAESGYTAAFALSALALAVAALVALAHPARVRPEARPRPTTDTVTFLPRGESQG